MHKNEDQATNFKSHTTRLEQVQNHFFEINSYIHETLSQREWNVFFYYILFYSERYALDLR
jgi:hypothetical protein